VEEKHQSHNTLSQLRWEIEGELAYLLEGFFSSIEVRYFELAGQRTGSTPEISNTIRELLFRRQDITLGFGSSVVASVDSWLYCGKEKVDIPGGNSFVTESSCSVRAHFAEVLRQIDRRSRERVQNAWDLEYLPISPEPLCHCFVAVCRDVCAAEISLHTTAFLFRRLVVERLGNLYGRINRVLATEDADDHTPSRRQEEVAEISAIYGVSYTAAPSDDHKLSMLTTE
jgi:hypothetical protein